jgi:hypothetical protein
MGAAACTKRTAVDATFAGPGSHKSTSVDIAAHSESDERGVPLRDCGRATRGPLNDVDAQQRCSIATRADPVRLGTTSPRARPGGSRRGSSKAVRRRSDSARAHPLSVAADPRSRFRSCLSRFESERRDHPLLVKWISLWSTKPALAVRVGRRGLQASGAVPHEAHNLVTPWFDSVGLLPHRREARAPFHTRQQAGCEPLRWDDEPRAMVALFSYKERLLSSILRRGTDACVRSTQRLL